MSPGQKAAFQECNYSTDSKELQLVKAELRGESRIDSKHFFLVQFCNSNFKKCDSLYKENICGTCGATRGSCISFGSRIWNAVVEFINEGVLVP